MQKGTFLFTLNNSKSIAELIVQNEKRVKKLVISHCLYPQIRKDLNDHNCNALALFTGIERFARYFQNHELE